MKPCEENLSRCPPPPDQAGKGETLCGGRLAAVPPAAPHMSYSSNMSYRARLARLLVQAFVLLVGYLDAGSFEARKIFWHWYRRAPDGAVVLRPLSVGDRHRKSGAKRRKRWLSPDKARRKASSRA